MQNFALSDTKTVRHLQVQCMAPSTTGNNLAHQLVKLRGAGSCLMHGLQPMTQHIGHPGSAQGLQRTNRRRHTHLSQVLGRHLVQQCLRLGRMGPVSYTHLDVYKRQGLETTF